MKKFSNSTVVEKIVLEKVIFIAGDGKDFNSSSRFETKLRIDKSKRSITSVSFDSGQRIVDAITQTSSDSQCYG